MELKIVLTVEIGDQRVFKADAENFDIAIQQLARLESATETKYHCPNCGYCDKSSCDNCSWCGTSEVPEEKPEEEF